ncbi:hypothetical protein V6N13_087796 [Hibiscus sabdariffa]
MDANTINSVKVLSNELSQFEVAEREFYKQRAKVQWLNEADQSTKLFYSVAKVKNRRQSITSILNDVGAKLDTHELISDEIVNFYSSLLGAKDLNTFTGMSIIGSLGHNLEMPFVFMFKALPAMDDNLWISQPIPNPIRCSDLSCSGFKIPSFKILAFHWFVVEIFFRVQFELVLRMANYSLAEFESPRSIIGFETMVKRMVLTYRL